MLSSTQNQNVNNFKRKELNLFIKTIFKKIQLNEAVENLNKKIAELERKNHLITSNHSKLIVKNIRLI